MSQLVKKNKEKAIELKKETSTSIIAVQRQDILTYTTLDAKTLDELYATVPEISRAVDLRGASIISRGFEITAKDEISQGVYDSFVYQQEYS